jgi:hypothetical protein
MRVVATLIPVVLLLAAVASQFGLLRQDVVDSMRISGLLIVLASISAIVLKIVPAQRRVSLAVVFWAAFALGGLLLMAFPVPVACAIGLLKESCA